MTPRSLIVLRDELCVPHGYLYVFAAKNLVKVGMTKFSIYRRWHGIRSSNPWLEPPLYVSPPLMEKVSEAERACHVALAQYRSSGEWFDCDRGLALTTVRSIVDATRAPS